MGSQRSQRFAFGWDVSRHGARLAALLCGLAVMTAARAADVPDDGLLEFLGSIDTEDKAWHDYLARTDIDQVARRPANPSGGTGNGSNGNDGNGSKPDGYPGRVQPPGVVRPPDSPPRSSPPSAPSPNPPASAPAGPPSQSPPVSAVPSPAAGAGKAMTP